MDDLGIPFDKNQPFRWVLRIKRGAQPAPVKTTEPTAIELDYQALIPPPMSAREYIQSEGQMIAPKERTLKICRPAKSIDWVYVRQ
ncbi:MAG: hypothetical protein KDI77_17600, partial [Gammaproteobacteria bacterium]|nr:hypothetical protein [Gammaproteobacteria bacterium]